MHFLELARFLNTSHLAGCKVNCTLRPAVGLYALLLVYKPWFSSQTPLPHNSCMGPEITLYSFDYLILSYLVLICIKLPMNLFFYMALAPYDFDAGQRH